MNWKLWIYGLGYAVIGAAAGAGTNYFVLPIVFNGATLRQLFVATGLNAGLAGLGAFLGYLKTHPLPALPAGVATERRSTP
jgi:hypothetical protein